MFLIVGLGNPGKEYANTRHNVGFLFVDWLLEKGIGFCPPDKGGGGMSKGIPSSIVKGGFGAWKKGFQGTFCQGELNGTKALLLKPETYMNLSGKSVQSCTSFYKIPTKNIILISDDIDMEFGKIRFRETGSAGGHNGIASIIESLGTRDIKRIKIGIGRHPNMEATDWVLSKFSKEEQTKLEEIFEEGEKKLLEKLYSA